MTKLALTRTLVVAAIVGVAALVTAYLYRDKGNGPTAPQVASAPDSAQTGKTDGSAETSGETSISRSGVKSDMEAGVTEVPAAAKKGDLSFDVVSVEPTGETVVAGRSDPGAIVGLMANGKLVGKAIANQDGEWSIVLEKPLGPGDYDVNLQGLDESDNPVGDASGQRLAVSVPEDGKQRPLVVLNSLDAPSSVLQVPSAPTETAAADMPAQTPVTAGKAADKAAVETQVAAVPQTDQPSATSQQPDATPAPVSGNGQGGADKAAPAVQAEAGKSDAAPMDAEKAQVAAGDAVQPSSAAPGEAAQETASADTSSENTSAAPEGQAAASAPASETPAVPATAAETAASSAPVAAQKELAVTVDAVEAESGKVYTAGTGEAGYGLRIYVGDALLGSTKIGDNGRWLVEGGMDLATGPVEVRADMIGADGNTVVARAAVTFERAEEETIVLTRVEAAGEGGADGGNEANAGKTLPNVIIRKGDNLWNISRRLYGDGFRYTTIYQANKGQIRNPDLIYPGQVFLTPEGDLNWKPAQ